MAHDVRNGKGTPTMTNVVAFPIRNPQAPVADLQPVNIDLRNRRSKTIANMRDNILQGVNDALLEHGSDKDKIAMIVTAISLAVADLSKIAASPVICLGVEQELRLLRIKGDA